MAESSANRRRVDDGGGGGEVPPLLEYGVFLPAVVDALISYDEDMLQRITDKHTVDAQNRNGQTLLMMAVVKDSVASMRFLIERGAAVNIQDRNLKRTALHFACEHLSDDALEEVFVLLLRVGADPTLKNKYGETPRDLISDGGEF